MLQELLLEVAYSARRARHDYRPSPNGRAPAQVSQDVLNRKYHVVRPRALPHLAVHTRHILQRLRVLHHRRAH